MLNEEYKVNALNEIAEYRKILKEKPYLYNLFFELTLRCNERCLHCGSSCGDIKSSEMTVAQYDKLMHEIAEDFDISDKNFLLNVTGGEPLIRKDFFEIMEIANKIGYYWGMTSNATLITKDVAKDLKRVGLKSVSISIDGLPETHDAFRRTPGGWQKAMDGIQNLIDYTECDHVCVTTVVTHKNINELKELYKIFDAMDIDSWRVFEIDPIGRALQHPEYLLSSEDYKNMVEFIRNMRIKGEPVTYGCAHYTGLEYEREIRDWYYRCTAGTNTASIACNGDILACLDIERRPELIQGNVLKGDRFSEVWFNKFKPYRSEDLSCRNDKCKNCEHAKYCAGGAFHTYDFDKEEQRICFKDILF